MLRMCVLRRSYCSISIQTRLQETELGQLVDELRRGELPADGEVYAVLLRRSMESRDLAQGRRVHLHVVETGGLRVPNVFLSNAVMEMYAKCGDLEQAKKVFSEMEGGRNSYSWNVMVAAYAQNGHPCETLRMFQTMDLEGGKPYKHSYSNMLTACANLGALAPGRDIHSDVVASGLQDNVIIATALVNLYGKCGSLRSAWEAFERISNPDVVSWSSIIAVFSQGGYHREAITIYRKMLAEGVEPEEVTFVSLVAACTASGSVKEAEELHSCAVDHGYEVDAIFGGSLVNLYGKAGNLRAAQELHDKMNCRNVVSWTALIAAYVQHGRAQAALRCFIRMDHEGVKVNDVSFINILGACCSPEFLESGRKVHQRIVASGYQLDGVLGTALVNMYGKCGSIRDAMTIFHSMKQRDTVAWNAMLAAFVQVGYYKETWELCLRMQLEGGKPDDGTFVSLLDARGEMEDLNLGRKIHGWIAGTDLEQDEGVASALINMYGKCGSVIHAKKLFDCCWTKKTLLAWNAMAAVYAQLGYAKEAIALCHKLDLEGFKFDEGMFVSAFSACSSLSSLSEGKNFHQKLLFSGLVCNISVWNSLINMYGKCGSVEDARQVFECDPVVKNRDLITWNAMFDAYAQKGLAQESLKLLRKMDMEGVKSDEITFISILTACGSSASLSESKVLHQRAIACGLESGDTVGGLLVNAYGKCGSLETARNLFDRMPRKDLFTWTALLASYAQHGHGNEALEVYQNMDLEGLKPSDITFITILFACSHAGLLQEGRRYFLSMTGDHGLTPLEDHYKCLIDLLARVGLLSEAEDLINGMPYKPDYLSWITLLAACKVHNDFERADRAAENALKMDPQNPIPCVVLSNMYAGEGDQQQEP